MASPAVCSSCQTPLPAEAQFCPRCGSRTPTQISGGGTTSVAIPPDQLEEQQERLQAALGPDYAVERLLGSGGFATVWAAFDRKLQREVAVKVLHPDLVATRSLLERFQREAQAVAKLRHPGVIPIYAVGEHEGLAFYIMPLVQGESLRERLRRERTLPLEEARRILHEAAAALAVAHRAGIVHRDIKPENLMLEGEERRVVLMDFGIAKSTGGAGAQTGLTGTGMIIGTPAYMSPEQATGSKEIDVRSDVYSLGVVGFEMLTGKAPFEAPSVPELILQQVATPAPSVASLRADTPEDLAIAVNRCLQKEPGQRWKNAGDLSVFLERVSTPVAQTGAVSKDLRRFARRGWRPSGRQVFWTTGAALLLASLLVSGASLGDLRVSIHYWASKLGLIKPLPPAADVTAVNRVQVSGPPFSWVLSGASTVLSLGGTNLAVVDARNRVFGLHLFDGQAWRSYRTPEPIGAATRQGNDILLFAERDGGHMYRWTATGVVAEDTVPFGASAAWADGRTVVLLGSKEGQLATRDARGWHRYVSARRTQLSVLAGTAANDLAALGYFAGAEDHPDSIVEYDGTSWETLDPRPSGTKERWVYNAIATLGDRSLVVGGLVSGAPESRPLLLARASRGRWRRLAVKTDSASTVRDVEGIWGTGPDDLFAWDPGCGTCRLAEIRSGVWSESPAMGTGSVLGVAQAGGVVYAVWADGTVWARRDGRWVFATEVPNTTTSFVAAQWWSDWSSDLWLGRGVLSYSFREASQSIGSYTGAVDSVPGGGRGAAVARMVGWMLGSDGVVRRIDCRVGPRCTLAQESFVGGLSLTQRKHGGALLTGVNGLFLRSSESGSWQRVSAPAAMARESLLYADESPDGHLAVLGSEHLAILDSTGKVMRVSPLSAPERPRVVVMAYGGAVAQVFRDRVSLERLDGKPIADCCGWLYANYSVLSWQALPDGRLVFGLGGDASDPFSQGALLVVALDSSRARQMTVILSRVRSRVTALATAQIGNLLVVFTPSGSYRRPVTELPFAENPGTLAPQRRR